jgi:ribosomal protein S18 acetylase RimI-like enzyme
MDPVIAIQPLRTFSDSDFQRIVQGYITRERYRVERDSSEAGLRIQLTLEALPKPFQKEFSSNTEELTRYRDHLGEGFSFGAYRDQHLVGLVLAQPHWWNKSLWVWEFHVDPAYQHQGIGRQLMEAVAGKAEQAGLRVLVCETQNTNVNAIRAYRRLGFEVEGIDLSYYTNHDIPDGEVAIFMKRQLKERI